MGRNAAGESFLKGFFLHSKQADSIWVHNEDQEEIKNLQNWQEASNRSEEITSVNRRKYARLKDASMFYTPGPELSPLAWRRRFFGDDAWVFAGYPHDSFGRRNGLYC